MIAVRIQITVLADIEKSAKMSSKRNFLPLLVVCCIFLAVDKTPGEE